MPLKDNLKVGKPDVSLERPAHTSGVHTGNHRGAYESMEGHYRDGTSDARRSTGIDPEARNPILDSMPNISPP